MDNECILGIDFGTIASCAAVYYKKKIEVIQDEIGKRSIPSVACYTGSKILVGESADKNKIEYVQSTIFECKRFIGHLYNDPHLKRDYDKYAVKIIEDTKNKTPKYEIKIGKQTIYKFPSDVALDIIKYIKHISELHIKKIFKTNIEIKKAVITVPFHFTEDREKAMKTIAENAGFKQIDVLIESDAAGIAYGYYREHKIDENILLFDIGGGTCGVSVLGLKKNNAEIKLLGRGGKGHAGGENFEEQLRDYIKKKIKEKPEFKNLDFKKNDKATLRAFTKIKDKTKNVISQLSMDEDAVFKIAELYEEKDFELKITRKDYMDLCNELLKKCYEACTKALDSSNIKEDNINKIVLSGGSSRTPGIQEYLKKQFRNATFSQEINADEACAQGAALFKSNLVRIIEKIQNNSLDKNMNEKIKKI